MAIRLEVIDEVEALYSLSTAWQALADEAGISPLFRGPRWLLSWWRAYQRQLGAELYTLAVFDDDALVGLAPLYRRQARRTSTRKLEEVRLMGDAGPRPPALGLLASPGYEERVGVAIADYLTERASEWDLIELMPLEDPSSTRAHMVNRFSTFERPMDSNSAGRTQRLELQAAGWEQTPAVQDKRAIAYQSDPDALRKGLAVLRRLSRLEWAHRDEASPYTDRQATHLLEDLVLPLGIEGYSRLARLNDQDGQAIAAALIVDDGARAVVLAMAVDPECPEAAPRLLATEAQAARERGMKSMDLSSSTADYGLPKIPVTRARATHLSVYGTSSSASLARTYGKVRRRVTAAKDAPGAAAAGARAAWSRIRTAASHIAGVDRMHLYRGELWTRGVANTAGLTMQLFSESDYEALDPAEREQLVESLEVDDLRIRQIWQRGDIAVLARINGRSAGIVWCACQRVKVPELDRFLELGPGEAYIHDLFVSPQARGRSLAPSILEFLAMELRQRDIYKSWALIGSDNIASVRAFEKAAYAAVADVVHAHIGGVDRLVLRPPDVEAKKLLGL